ncbi:hypothetical protein WH47_08478 [Habropoda laboriosa]|uniref:Uncharacterized protein n=1 Tax=Habropoda laboriosa TaxID=597456 RepID=A0A0L7QNF5_9HYME|nr:hypothetical protein WH47_08478 [Habropoda laboriosa]
MIFLLENHGDIPGILETVKVDHNHASPASHVRAALFKHSKSAHIRSGPLSKKKKEQRQDENQGEKSGEEEKREKRKKKLEAGNKGDETREEDTKDDNNDDDEEDDGGEEEEEEEEEVGWPDTPDSKVPQKPSKSASLFSQGDATPTETRVSAKLSSDSDLPDDTPQFDVCLTNFSNSSRQFLRRCVPSEVVKIALKVGLISQKLAEIED